jgi:hypothetical protein
MTFMVNDLRTCSGGNHIAMDMTPNGRVMRTSRFLRSQVLAELDADRSEEAVHRILLRCISAVKEAITGPSVATSLATATARSRTLCRAYSASYGEFLPELSRFGRGKSAVSTLPFRSNALRMTTPFLLLSHFQPHWPMLDDQC